MHIPENSPFQSVHFSGLWHSHIVLQCSPLEFPTVSGALIINAGFLGEKVPEELGTTLPLKSLQSCRKGCGSKLEASHSLQ